MHKQFYVRREKLEVVRHIALYIVILLGMITAISRVELVLQTDTKSKLSL